MKKIVSLILAPVLVLTLCCPLAFAAPIPVPPSDVATAESADAPRYAVYTKAYTIDMQNNTYADLVFTMADKNGTAYFEDLVSISFRTTNPNGSHWEILEYSYTINPTDFWLYTTLRDMEGNTPSSNLKITFDSHLTPINVIGYSLLAQNENGVVLPPASVNVSVVVVPGWYQDESGIPVLNPESVGICYLGEKDISDF